MDVIFDFFDFYSNKSIYMKENQIQTISCKTSACLPKPLVKWYLLNPINNITYDITNHSTESYILKENWLTVAESILRILPNRTLDRWHLYCTVWTQVKAADIFSEEFVLNVACTYLYYIFRFESYILFSFCFILTFDLLSFSSNMKGFKLLKHLQKYLL
jgi:hypothetical protein